MSEARALVKSLFSLTKPRVVVLLQITAMCAILCHDLIESNKINRNTLEIMFIVFIGGYLTAGGANCINMWYDRDIDPIMIRTSKRPLSVGDISPQKALLFGISTISIQPVAGSIIVKACNSSGLLLPFLLDLNLKFPFFL